MEAVLFYFGKMFLTSGLMFGYYQLFLRDKTFHHYNRFYLLATLVVSLLLPLLKLRYFTIPVNNDLYLLINQLRPVSNESDKDTGPVPGIFAGIVALISLVFIVRFLQGIFKVLKLKRRFPKELIEDISFYRTDLSNAPFSYFRNLFWKNDIPLHSDLGRQIMMHEMAHIEQKHTYDKIMTEVIRAVFWFNPFFHLIKKELHLIHEYLADHKAIKRSDTKAFAQMLLASHFSGNILPAASPFLNTHLKKRLQMIKTSKTRFSYARKALALPLLFVVAFACVVNAQNREIKATNNEIARAAEQIERTAVTTVTTKWDTVINTDGSKKNPKELKPSADMIQSELKIGDMDKQIAQIERTLQKLEPASEEASLKFDQIAALSEKISAIVNSEDFQNHINTLRNSGTQYIHVLNKEELAAIMEAAARATEAGAAALAEARAAMKEAAVSKAAAALNKKEMARAKAAADIARDKAAVARKDAMAAREQAAQREKQAGDR